MKNYKVEIISGGSIIKEHSCGYNKLPLLYDQNEFKRQFVKVCITKESIEAKAVIDWVHSHVDCLHNNSLARLSLQDGGHVQYLVDAVKRSVVQKPWVSCNYV